MGKKTNSGLYKFNLYLKQRGQQWARPVCEPKKDMNIGWVVNLWDRLPLLPYLDNIIFMTICVDNKVVTKRTCCKPLQPGAAYSI